MTATTTTAKYRRLLLVLLMMLILTPAAGLQAEAPGKKSTQDRIELRMKPMPEGVRKLYLIHVPAPSYLLLYRDGHEETLSPEAFSKALYNSAGHRPRIFRVLNISSTAGVAWVLLGLLGQVLFTGRMVVQWLTSERARRSVVPVAFWWMSLSGATMLLIYFSWRRDIVGILGQSTGWFIYSRNLWLIYHKGN